MQNLQKGESRDVRTALKFPFQSSKVIKMLFDLTLLIVYSVYAPDVDFRSPYSVLHSS